MNKTKLLIGFLVIAGMSMVLTSGTQLAKADINEGVGSMMGLSQDCSACQSGGSSCIGQSSSTCESSTGCIGTCGVDCPWTAGVVCNYTGSPGSCNDGSASCGTFIRDSCWSYAAQCECHAIPWTTVNCGSRNTCS